MAINIPNTLTIFRILCVPVFILLVLEGRLYWAAGVFFTAAVTDAIDGFIARKFDLMTPLGAFMDPIADKLLLTSAYLILTYKGLVPLWLFIVVVFRDLLMIAGLVIIKALGKSFAAVPTYLGKFTTGLQVSAVVYAIVISDRLGPEPFRALIIATALVTLYSAVDYTIREVKKQFIVHGG